jgi:hypothetical protein
MFLQKIGVTICKNVIQNRNIKSAQKSAAQVGGAKFGLKSRRRKKPRRKSRTIKQKSCITICCGTPIFGDPQTSFSKLYKKILGYSDSAR